MSPEAPAPEAYDPSRLHVEVSGPDEGEPVLLLHGWGSSAALMRPLARALDDTFYVVNVDLPGHGGSPPPAAGWGVPEHAALVRQVIEARMGGGPVTAVGHSNGGRIALHMAADAETAPLFRRLALISPSGVPRQRTWKYHLRSKTAKALKAPFEALPEPYRAHTLDWLRHSLVWRLLGSSDYAALQGAMRDTFVKTVNHYVDDRLERISVPVLLFWGDRDDAVTREQMRVLETRIPDAGLVTLDGAGHYGHLDDPVTVAAALRHFLEHPEAEPEAAA